MPSVPVAKAGDRPVATGRWLRGRDRSTESTSFSRPEASRPIAPTLAVGSTTVKATRRTAELVTAPACGAGSAEPVANLRVRPPAPRWR